jgi:hypothetical protein
MGGCSEMMMGWWRFGLGWMRDVGSPVLGLFICD